MSLPPRQCPAPAGLDETDDVGDPVAVGAQRQYRGAAARKVRATSARCAAAALAKSSRSWASMVNSRVTPDSASCSTTSPMSGSSTSRGSSTSMASTSCRAAIARSGRIQLIGPRKSLMITAMPRRRSGRRSASMAVARSPRTPTGALGVVAMVRNSVCSCWRPERAGTRVIVCPLAISAPSRLPPPLLRNVIAAAAATARSRFSHTVVPKSRLADMSTTSQVSSSRSAIICRTWGCMVRAVTAQSIRRTSSPGWYSRDSPGSEPGPGIRPRWSPCRTPSSLRLTVSSSVRRAAASFGSTICPRSHRWRM